MIAKVFALILRRAKQDVKKVKYKKEIAALTRAANNQNAGAIHENNRRNVYSGFRKT
jgi:hypothetical protein